MAAELEALKVGSEECPGPRLPASQRRRAHDVHAHAKAGSMRLGQESLAAPLARKAMPAAMAGWLYAQAIIQNQETRMVLESMREDRVGTLARFIEYLKANGVVEGRPKEFEEHHVLQKYAYLASMLGAPLHYEFDFLENGAYSSDLAIDLYANARPGSGTSPFKKNPKAGVILVRMVSGRGKRTLQAMTFAMRDMLEEVEREEFVDTMCRERGLYGRRMLEWSFDRVFEACAELDGKNG